LIREDDNMKIEDIINVITHSVLYYCSLIRKFDITDKLISGVEDAICRMWYEFMSDVDTEENIDLIGVMDGDYSDVFKTNDSNLYGNITHVITSYFDKVKKQDPSIVVIEIYNFNYLPGLKITHSQISSIVGFYLNQ
jgi:hypothetical protein